MSCRGRSRLPVPTRPAARRGRRGRAALGVVAAGLAGLTGAACGSDDSARSEASLDLPSTVGGVGQLPAPLSGAEGAAGPAVTFPTTSTRVPRSTVERPDDLGLIGERVDGNRLLMIGDSIMASTARRYGGEMCFTLLPLGWAVEVNAEVSRFVDFGDRVLDRRLRPDDGVDWDAAVVFLGSNYGGDIERYRAELFEILDRLAPRPTLLVTVTEFRPDRFEVNEVIRSMVDFYPEVEVLDWAAITRDEPNLLAPDGLHLSDDGRARLAGEIAFALGPAPPPEETAVGDTTAGECLSTSFTDDSAGQRPGAAPPPPFTGGGSATASTTATTQSPVATTATTTTVGTRPTVTTTTSPATSDPATSVSSSSPPTSTLPVDPTSTAAPTTAAPTTVPTTTAASTAPDPSTTTATTATTAAPSTTTATTT